MKYVCVWSHLELGIFQKEQASECTFNLTLRRVLAAMVAVEKQ
jgi:hypothetical protein